VPLRRWFTCTDTYQGSAPSSLRPKAAGKMFWAHLGTFEASVGSTSKSSHRRWRRFLFFASGPIQVVKPTPFILLFERRAICLPASCARGFRQKTHRVALRPEKPGRPRGCPGCTLLTAIKIGRCPGAAACVRLRFGGDCGMLMSCKLHCQSRPSLFKEGGPTRTTALAAKRKKGADQRALLAPSFRPVSFSKT